MVKETSRLERLAKCLYVNVEDLEQSLDPFIVLDSITTFDEAKRVYGRASSVKLRKAVLLKMLELSTTFNEASTIYLYHWGSFGGALKEAALAKMTEIGIPLLVTATLDEARAIYDKAPPGSELNEAALAKINEIGITMLATATLDEAKIVYNRAPSGSELKKAALIKMLELV